MPLNVSLSLDAPYKPCSDIARRRRSAARAIWTLLTAPGLTTAHRRELLGIGIWKYTEAEGCSPHPKYRLRLRSAGAIDLTVPAPVQHEHVWPRKWLIDRLLRGGGRGWDEASLGKFLAQYAVACTVTKAEHGLLTALPSSTLGWDRYVHAGVAVWDMQTGQPFALAADTSPERGEERPARRLPPPEDAFDTAAVMDRYVSTAKRPAIGAFLDWSHQVGLDAVLGIPKKGAAKPPYVRLIDASADEPGPTIAYVHWSGLVSYRLAPEDLPPDCGIPFSVTRDATYGVQMNVSGGRMASSLELLEFALEKAREP